MSCERQSSHAADSADMPVPTTAIFMRLSCAPPRCAQLAQRVPSAVIYGVRPRMDHPRAGDPIGGRLRNRSMQFVARPNPTRLPRALGLASPMRPSNEARSPFSPQAAAELILAIAAHSDREAFV